MRFLPQPAPVFAAYGTRRLRKTLREYNIVAVYGRSLYRIGRVLYARNRIYRARGLGTRVFHRVRRQFLVSRRRRRRRRGILCARLLLAKASGLPARL